FLNSAKTKAQYRQGRESKAVVNKGTLKELNWWTLKLSLNNPTSLIIRKPDTPLTTDASQWIWGEVCRIKRQDEIFVHGKWSKVWHLTSFNQRELAAILCCLRRLEQDLMQQEVNAIKIQTDNTTTTFNLRRQAAAGPLAQKTTRILNWAKAKDIQLQTVYIPGASNSTADTLSRLARSGDYSVTQVRTQQVMKKLDIQAQVDVFAIRRNRVFKTYCSPKQDSREIARDGLVID
ncbi:MAG: hypothetical protein EZS28_009128, partial [Streblomastix strix]